MNYKDTITWKEINETPRIVDEIRSANEETMNELVKTVKKSKITNFITAARGSSNNAVTFFKYLLEVMSNYTVGSSAPSIVTLYRGKINYANSIILGCSQSGMADDVLEVIRRGNDQGAITVSITNDVNSPIAKESKFHLYINATEQKSLVATKTFNAELYILLWLAVELSRDRDDSFYLKHLMLDLEQVIPEIDALTEKYVEMFENSPNAYIISRGLTYPIALEASLILQTTCYMQASGFAGSEFFQGPLSAVGADTPVIVFCAKNTGDEEIQSIIRADQIRCVEKVLSQKAPVLVVTNDSMITDVYSRCKYAFLNFNLPEEFSIFAFALFSQMLACKLSCRMGLNPDNPRALEKTVMPK